MGITRAKQLHYPVMTCEAAREKIPVSTNSGDFYGFLRNHRCIGMGWTYRRAESIVTIEIFRGKKSGRRILFFHDEIMIFVDEVGEKSEKLSKTIKLHSCSLVFLMVSPTFRIFRQPR